jgi:hypothetical protein
MNVNGMTVAGGGQHSTFNIQHSTFNIQRSTSKDRNLNRSKRTQRSGNQKQQLFVSLVIFCSNSEGLREQAPMVFGHGGEDSGYHPCH